MTRFTSFFDAIPDNTVPPPKIALISDGVDPTSETLRGKISQTQPGITIFSGKFGTTAARLITQIFPKSQLYIAKVEEPKSESKNGIQSLLSSAIEVNQKPVTLVTPG